MKKKIISLIVALALAVPVVTGVVPTLSEGAAEDIEISKYPVEINEENFPDVKFREYVLSEERRIAEENGEDPDGMLSEEEIAGLTIINVEATDDTAEEDKIASLKGIEFFSELITLNCNNNKLTDLDISENTKLKYLFCTGNQLTALDCSEKPYLEFLKCQDNRLTYLNTSGCTLLRHLECLNNELTVLDLSDNVNLTHLWCENNQLAFLDLSQNTQIKNAEGGGAEPNLKYYSNGKKEKVPCIGFVGYSYDLKEKLPDTFDMSKTSNWLLNDEPIEIKDGIISFDIAAGKGAKISYNYNSENAEFGELKFTIEFSPNHNIVEAKKSDVCFTFPKLYVCEDCNNYFLEGEVLITGSEWIKDSHSFDEWTEVKASTCSENGIKIRTCSDCGYVEYGTTPFSDHTFVEGEYESDYGCSYCQHWRVCTECGQEFDRDYHDIDPLTNTCVVCGESFDHVHDFENEFMNEKAPTCTEDGMMAHFYCAARRMYYIERPDGRVDEVSREDLIIEKTGHQYELKHDEDQHWEECELCGDKQNAENHEFDDGVVIKEATCEDGIIRYTCICGYHYDDIIPSEGEHRFTECEYLNKEQHVFVCAVCGEKSELTEDHEYDIEVIQPSCFESGKMIHTCKDCGYSYQEISGEPTGNHSFSAEFKYNVDYHWHECETKGCDAVDSREEHTWNEGVITVPPTVDNPGVRIYTCIECEAEKSEWVDKLDPPEKDPNETEPEQSKPNESEPEQSKPNESEPEQSKPDESEPEQSKPDESEPEQSKPDESEPEQSKPDESEPEQSKPNESEPEQSKPDESEPEQSKPDETDPIDTKPEASDSSSREPDVIISDDSTTSADTNPSVVNPDNDGNNKGDNTGTGLIISMIPAAAAGVSVVIFKKRSKK